MNLFFHEKNKIVWCVCFFLYVGCIFFLIVSLVSYTITDNSWFYVSSELNPITNQAGFLGAQVAAILYYLFGGASFLVLIPLITSGIFFIRGRTFYTDGERLIAACALVCIGAMLLTTFVIDFSWSPYPGGIIGLCGIQKLDYYFEYVGRMVFLYVSLCASLIVLLQWSFMFLIESVITLIVMFAGIMQKYRVVNRVMSAIRVFIWSIFVRLPLCLAHFMKSLVNGTAFDETGLLYPNDPYELDYEYADNAPTKMRLNFVMVSLSPSIDPKKKIIITPIIVTFIPRNKESEHISSLDKTEYDIPSRKITLPLTKTKTRYVLPQMDIFVAEKNSKEGNAIESELQERAQVLEDKLKRFGVNGNVVAIKRGPVVTLFEYQPDVDTKLSKIVVLEDDLAMALQAMSIRIIAPIPGRSVVGFEVSNTTRHDVLFSQIITQDAYTKFTGNLPLILGKGTIGQAVVVDLARMPHLLIAGSTGSGKSVALNAILMSLLCKLSPDDLRFILIDPKRLEFAAFTDIAHLLFPIITNPALASSALRWVVQEMEDRYEKMAQCGARNITDYNAKISAMVDDDNRSATDNTHIKKLPFIVVVIDELADLMLTAGRDIEDLITRITQMARAAGIHMIVATQRPSVDVITGLIKANFPSRISFRVASRIDSRTILDTVGADRLLGRGDMLFMDASTSQLKRVHGAYVSDEEIEHAANHIRQQRKVEYFDLNQLAGGRDSDLLPADDALYKDVCQFLDEIDEISISLLQRKFRIGYNRSARIIDTLESQGLIMPQDGSKTRKVIRS